MTSECWWSGHHPSTIQCLPPTPLPPALVCSHFLSACQHCSVCLPCPLQPHVCHLLGHLQQPAAHTEAAADGRRPLHPPDLPPVSPQHPRHAQPPALPLHPPLHPPGEVSGAAGFLQLQLLEKNAPPHPPPTPPPPPTPTGLFVHIVQRMQDSFHFQHYCKFVLISLLIYALCKLFW